MKLKSDSLNVEVQVREFEAILQQIYENYNDIAEKVEEMQVNWDVRLKSLENKYQELDSRMRYTRMD